MKNKIIPFFYVLFIIVFFSSCAMTTLVNGIKEMLDNSSDSKAVTLDKLKITLPIISKELKLGDFWLKGGDESIDLEWPYDEIRNVPYIPYSSDLSSLIGKTYSWPNGDILSLELSSDTINLGKDIKIPEIDLNGDGISDISVSCIKVKDSSIKAYIKLKDSNGILRINKKQFLDISADIIIDDKRGRVRFNTIREFDLETDNTNDVSDFDLNGNTKDIVVAIAKDFLIQGWGDNLFPMCIDTIKIEKVMLKLTNDRTDPTAVHDTSIDMVNILSQPEKLMKFDVNLRFSFGKEEDISVIGKVNDEDINLLGKFISLNGLESFMEEATLITKISTDFPFGIKLEIDRDNSTDFVTDQSIDISSDSTLMGEGYKYKKPDRMDRTDEPYKTTLKISDMEDNQFFLNIDIVPITETDASGDKKNIGDVIFDADAKYNFHIDLELIGKVKQPI